MSYLVLARKYRPATFDEIVGQEHVTRALKNAIRLDRVAHAFLFTGARGVGKTTAARVLAKALQCETGPREEPCGTCRACEEIARGSAVDVFEIDGASNRGINEIRELRDGVAYAPARDRLKLYIIDEVHMLTSEAFNALLKTLEEPPRHVKFIFATTEPQKIPVTILSRCQRYDFKRVPLARIKDHLDNILGQEGVTVAAEGVRMVARESEGSVRDALSLMDRVISFAGASADAQTVADCLGIADRKWLITLVRGVLTGNTADALAVVGDVHNYGYDMRAFTSDLLNTIRDLIVVKVCGSDARAAELSDAEARALEKLGADHSVAALQRMFQLLLKAADDVAISRHPRLVLEMAVIRAAAARDLQSVPEVLARLESLESRLGSGAPPTNVVPLRPTPQPQPTHQPPQKPPHQTATNTTINRRPQAPPPAHEPLEPPQDSPEPPPLGLSSPTAPPLTPATWPAFVDAVKDSDPLLASMLERARVTDSPTGLTLAVANRFYRSQLEDGPSRDRLAELLLRRHGVTAFNIEAAADDTGTIGAGREQRRARETTTRKDRVENHPVTRAVIDTLKSDLVDVRVEEISDE